MCLDYVALFHPVRDENRQLYNNNRWNTVPEHWNQSHHLFKAGTAMILCYTCHRKTLVHSEHSHTAHNTDNKRYNDTSYKSFCFKRPQCFLKIRRRKNNIFSWMFWTSLSSSVDILLFLLRISKLEKNQNSMKLSFSSVLKRPVSLSGLRVSLFW